jgi:two-component system, NtrC family, sensor histidine kinase HydH
MNPLIYLIATVFCVTLSVRAYLWAPTVPVRRTFLVFAGLLALSYVGFALYLLPGLGGLRYLHSVAGTLVPAASLLLVEQLFERIGPRRSRWSAWLVLVCPIVAFTFIFVDATWFRSIPRASPPEVVLFLFVFGAFSLTVEHLLRVRNELPPSPDRTRMTQLTVLVILVLAFSALEYLVRAFAPTFDASQLSALSRAILAQGAFPPIGAALGTLLVYALYEGTNQERAPDLRELLSRLLTLVVLAIVLVLIDYVTVFWTGIVTDYPVHGAFQLFVASLLFVAAYTPVRARVQAWASEWLNRPGERLELALLDINRVLPKLISLDGLEHEVLGRLVASGRVAVASLYLWDEDLGTYRKRLQRGTPVEPLLEAVALGAFTEPFKASERTYRLARFTERRGATETVEVRALVMQAMSADLTLALLSGQVVLGWLNLASVKDGHAWSPEEIRRLEAMVERMSVIVENIIGFERLKEQHRLAAIGEMSAGLAHEIRNPLAGIKGAAQYLQGESISGEMAELVEVIVSEVDRLNIVVSQFLDYARPYDIRPEPTDVRSLLRHVVDLVRAQGVPSALTLEFEAEPNLPELELDRDKVKQVLLNLVQNAVQATGAEGVVQVRAREGLLRNPGHRGEPALVLTVTDTGPGIAQETIDKLFIPFFTTKHDGTGLGLAISQRLVEAHGGEVGVRSRLGSGTTFTVRLPLRPTLGASAPPPPPSPVPGADPTDPPP